MPVPASLNILMTDETSIIGIAQTSRETVLQFNVQFGGKAIKQLDQEEKQHTNECLIAT